jgi:hypothetical protein
MYSDFWLGNQHEMVVVFHPPQLLRPQCRTAFYEDQRISAQHPATDAFTEPETPVLHLLLDGHP